MAIEPQYRELFSETVTLFPKVSVDKYGRRSNTASGQIVPAHLVAETRLTHTPDGREVVETGKVYLYGSFPNVDTDYLIVLDNGSSPIILGVDTPHDQIGAHHTVVRLGRTGA